MFKDMTARPRSRGAAHLLIATTPCPDFSTAGKHKGLLIVSHYLLKYCMPLVISSQAPKAPGVACGMSLLI